MTKKLLLNLIGVLMMVLPILITLIFLFVKAPMAMLIFSGILAYIILIGFFITY